MKRMVVMLLALCVMCTAMIGLAEERYQTLHLPHFDVKVSADWKLAYDAETMTYTGTAGEDVVVITEVDLRMVLEDAADEQAAHFALMDWAHGQAKERGAKESSAGASGFGSEVRYADVRWENAGIVNTLAYYVINGDAISIAWSSAKMTESQMEEMIFNLFHGFASDELAVYLPDGNQDVPAQSIAALGDGETVYNGLHTFTLPAGAVLASEPGVLTKAQAADYTLYVFSQQIPEDVIRDLTDDPIQFNNFAWMFLTLFDNDIDMMGLFTITLEDIGMPNGQDAAWASLDLGTLKIAITSQFYRDQSFMVYAVSETQSTDTLQNMVDSVALSLRFDGVTEEEMAADAMQRYIVITNSSANIRSGPDSSAAKITTAMKGEIFPLIGEDGNWYIIDVDGKTGYVTKGLSAIQE